MPTHKTVPVKIAHVGAEEFFRQEASSDEAPRFDKIILKDTIQYLQNPKVSLSSESHGSLDYTLVTLCN